MMSSVLCIRFISNHCLHFLLPVCSVIDAAELCRNVHYDDGFRTAAEDAFSTLSVYINTLNSNMRIFNSLKDIVSADKSERAALSAEEQILALDMFHELVTEGSGYSMVIVTCVVKHNPHVSYIWFRYSYSWRGCEEKTVCSAGAAAHIHNVIQCSLPACQTQWSLHLVLIIYCVAEQDCILGESIYAEHIRVLGGHWRHLRIRCDASFCLFLYPRCGWSNCSILCACQARWARGNFTISVTGWQRKEFLSNLS